MPHYVVQSSTLVSVWYLPDQSLLEVRFRDGTAYRFFDVPRHCLRDLLLSDSKGGYFNRNIRNRFRFERLSGRSRLPGKKTK